MALIAILLLSLWTLATVIVLVPKLGSPIRACDVLQLIPEWRFFAPRPGRSDYFLLYRTFGAGDQPTPWKEITLCRHRGLLNALWNPWRRENKAWIDLLNELLQLYQAPSKPIIETTIPYLAILRLATARAKAAGAGQAVQFLILSRDGMAGEVEMSPVLMSTVHSL